MFCVGSGRGTGRKAKEKMAEEEQAGQFDKLAIKAMDNLGEFLGNGDTDGKALARARVAATVLSSWTRHKQTEGAREATAFMMARELARDKEELARYIQVSLPGSPLVKLLPVPS